MLAVGRFLRMAVTGLQANIIFQELPGPSALAVPMPMRTSFTNVTTARVDPRPIMRLCDDIYMARQSGQMEVEQALFRELIELYRSPESIIHYTKPHAQ